MRTQRNPWLVLAVLCLAVFTILVDTNIVNVALPTLSQDLSASTTDLLWIVDAYNLAFAALVLAAGSLADRYGRKGALLVGLAVFGTSTALGSLLDSAHELIAARAVMGVGAAIIFPSTLSILTNVFTDRRQRASAIGIWGATTGLAVAAAPMVGGWLLEHFWWGSVFLAMAPLAAVALVLVAVVVPRSRDPHTPPVDKPGLVLSTAGLAVLVFSIIEAPERGWLSARTLGGFAAVVALLGVFVVWERRQAHPMLDVTLFRSPRFSAASGAVAVAFFALFGFIFLVTQYMQLLRGYTPLQTGVRLLPVATCVGVSSVLGARLALRLGNKVVVATGLGLMATGFLWISRSSVATPYLEIVGQMVVLGSGLGLTSAPATESIMGAVPPEKAGVGSAVNDATRELGGTLGVAIIGSVFASLYHAAIDRSEAVAALPAEAARAIDEGMGPAVVAVARVREAAGDAVAGPALQAARGAFFDGFAAGCLVAAGVAAAGAVAAALLLPARPKAPAVETVFEPAVAGG